MRPRVEALRPPLTALVGRGLTTLVAFFAWAARANALLPRLADTKLAVLRVDNRPAHNPYSKDCTMCNITFGVSDTHPAINQVASAEPEFELQANVWMHIPTKNRLLVRGVKPRPRISNVCPRPRL